MEKVAENLAIHPRTLQRLLNRERTHFGVLLGEARRELAVRYLDESHQSITDIALLLGYSTISSFTRWFTEEFGKSPAAWRKTVSPQTIDALTASAGGTNDRPQMNRMSLPGEEDDDFGRAQIG